MRKENPRLTITYQPTEDLKPSPGNARRRTKKLQKKLERSIGSLGLNTPILVDENNIILAGHGRWEAAISLGFEEVPTIILPGLSEEEKCAYSIADNRLAAEATWDRDVLVAQMQYLARLEIEFDLTLTGFDAPEIDLMLTLEPANAPDETALPALQEQVVTHTGDLWRLGKHKIYCGNALEKASYEALMGDERATIIITDPPYNVKIRGNVTKNAAHEEFAMASGEMAVDEFVEFLKRFAIWAVEYSLDGSIHYIFMDWRHLGEVLSAADGLYSELKNICVWAKDNGGMGSLYRSQHELVFVYKNGTAPHINNIELGKHGRNRTNLWSYPGQNSFGGRDQLLDAHPTVKPVGLIADMLLDCSLRKQIVLDPFGGSGTTLMAAERTGRHARLIELEPRYVDLTIRRWQKATGKPAVLAISDQAFDQVAQGQAGEGGAHE